MRKISREYENPIDNILIDICEILSPIAYSLYLTPNILTTISILFTMRSIYLITKSYYILASINYMISYYFDCMDGFFARKYKMYSKFGDYYDHFADILKFTSTSGILLYDNFYLGMKYIPFMLILGLLFNIHMVYQEMYYDKPEESETLHFVKKYIPILINDSKNKKEILDKLTYTRYFGCGTFQIIYFFIIISYKFQKKNEI